MCADGYRFFAGIDEAGYGPMLGPLVVSACAFELERPIHGADYWKHLARSVHPRLRGAGDRVVVADSKKLYSRKRGIRTIEETVWSFIQAANLNKIETLADYTANLSCGGVVSDDCRWHDYALKLPRVAFPNMARKKADALAEDMAQAGMAFRGAWSVPVHPAEFNRLIEKLDNKSLAEWEAVAGVLKFLINRFGKGGVQITVDRLGGRMRYGAQLYKLFKGDGVKLNIISQEKECSEYELRFPDGAARITFEEKADRKYFPVALASCFSKYLREVFMESLNRYFTGHDAALKPTEGYVTDARRWLGESEELRRRLRVDDKLFIRAR